MEQCNGKPIDPHMTMGVMSTMMDVDDEAYLERLVWAVYNGVLLPGDMPPLSGQHSLDRILSGTCRLIYRRDQDCQHCHASTISLANAKQALKRPGGCAPPLSNLLYRSPQELHLCTRAKEAQWPPLTTLHRKPGTTPSISVIQTK